MTNVLQDLSWSHLIVCFVALLLTLRFLLHIVLSLFIPRLTVRNVSILGLGGIEWRDESGLVFSIERIGWSCVGSNTSSKGWFILKLIRVKVVVPRKTVVEPRSPKTNPPRLASPTFSSSPRPQTPHPPPEHSPEHDDEHSRGPFGFIHAWIIAPTLARTHLIISKLTSLLFLFAIEVDLTIDLEDTLNVFCTINVGGEIVRPSKIRKKLHHLHHKVDHASGAARTEPSDVDLEPRIGAWIAISNLKIHETLAVKVTIPQTPTPLPAIEMGTRFVLSASAPFGTKEGLLTIFKNGSTSWDKGRATIRTSVKFESSTAKIKKCDDGGLHVRVHELKRTLAKIEDLIHERKEFKAHHRSTTSHHTDTGVERVKLKDRPSPLYFLRSVDVSIPLIVVSAYYHTPLHTLAACPQRSLPQSVAFALTIRGITGKLRMSGTSDIVKREHVEWLGKGRMLGLGGTFGWEEIEGRVKADGSAGQSNSFNSKMVHVSQLIERSSGLAEDILPNSAKTFSIGKSSVTTTSTWLPPALIESFAAHSPDLVTHTSPRCFNDETVIIEGYLGEVRGHAMYETIDSALRIFMARPRRQYTRHSKPSPSLSEESEPKSIKGVPRVIGHIASSGIEIRVQAPLIVGEDEDDDEMDRDHFYRDWACPELLCLSIPNGAFSFGGEYRDRSVRRSEVDRRNAKRTARYAAKRAAKGSNEVPAESLTKSTEKRILPHLPPTHSIQSESLGQYPVQYTARVHLAAETLNLYILATDAATGERGHEDSSIFLDEKPTLPSNTRRLDILAAGPLEVTSLQTIKGAVVMDDRIGAIPEFDLSTLIGENNVLIENVGIDLWRPIVMSAIRDFVSSWSSASATRTKAAPTPREHMTEPKPIFRSLPENQCVYLAMACFDLRVAGSDPKNDEKACRGIAMHSGPLILEYILQPQLKVGVVNFADRASLELSEDIRQEANALVNDGPAQALIKFTMNEWSIDPVVDARESRGHTKRYQMHPGDTDDEGSTATAWELRNRGNISDLMKRRKTIMVHRPDKSVKRIIHMPLLAVRMRILPVMNPKDGEALDTIIVTLVTRIVTVRLELFTIYLCLVAISALRSLTPKHLPDLAHRHDSATDEDEPSAPKRPKPLLQIKAEVEDTHFFITLPHNVPLFVSLKRNRAQYSKEFGLLLEWDSALLAGDSPTVTGKWDDLLRLRVTSLAIKPEKGNSGHQPFVVALSTESARLRIPFRYIVSRILDNAANLVKATKQLVHQHVKGGMNFVLEPQGEGPKKLPKISLNIKMFAIEIQDDPFETRLNIIWRAGYEEQQSRMERGLAFDAKLEAIRQAHEERGEELPDDVDPDDGRDFAQRNRDQVQREAAGQGTSAGPSGDHTISPRQAMRDLQAYNSSHWVKRMRNAVAEQARREESLTRRMYGVKHKHNSKRPDASLPIPLLPPSKAVPLTRATFHHLQLTISRTTFADEKLPDFLQDVGKGLPRDTVFTLLVPIHINWRMQEFKIQLRDYPLPLIHVPRVSKSTDKDDPTPSWELDTDLVIGEELGTSESVRRVPCVIVPAHAAKSSTTLYSIIVPRSAMTTKTYAVPTIRIRTPYATRIGWGNSISPAIHDVAKVLDTLSKQSPDPSERIGFWDKIRLQFHWRIAILFEGGGPVHFHLKGSRDPYSIDGFGAGFVKSWHGDVKFLLGHDNPDREFFQIMSSDYILGIPNLKEYIDEAATGLGQFNKENDDGDNHTTGHGSAPFPGQYSFGNSEDFIKVCCKLSHGVRWGMGCVVERSCTDKECDKPECKSQTPFHRVCRIWDFIPHWKVHTKTDASIKPNGEVDDSFAGFRSDFIHFSISLTAPATLELPSNEGQSRKNSSTDPARSSIDDRQSIDGSDETKGFNSMHFTPHALSHFSRWWRLFDGTMSLPIRQGKLFPSSQAPSKKFGKHCATIKYRFSFAPLFISHTYRQDSSEDWSKGETTVLGLKGKIGRFNVDMHQREQEELVTHPDTKVTKKVIHKAFYLAEVDVDDLDLRVVSAVFREKEKQEMAPPQEVDESDELPSTDQEEDISDEAIKWFDIDDFNDVHQTMIEKNLLRMRVLPFIACPRFTYYRQIDVARWTQDDAEADRANRHSEEGSVHETTNRDSSTSDEEQRERAFPKSKFGREPSHTCLVGGAKPALEIQIDAASARLDELEEELSMNVVNSNNRRELDARVSAIKAIITRLYKVRELEIEAQRKNANNNKRASTHAPKVQHRTSYYPSSPSHEPGEDEGEELSHITSNLYTQWGDWENRYIVHNPSIRLSNASRQILLKYYYSSQTRKAFVYHLSASAIKFIRDLASPTKEPARTRRSNGHRQSSAARRDSTVRGPSTSATSASAKRLLDELLKGHKEEGKDGKKERGRPASWAKSEVASGQQQDYDDGNDEVELDPETAAQLLPENYTRTRANLFMFIKPQIALTSDIDDKSTVILTAFRAQVKSFAVTDDDFPEDPINSNVLHSTFATIEGLQAFCPQPSAVSILGRKGLAVPLETLIDLRVEPWGFDRIVPRTSASMRYDKFNKLRLGSKKNTRVENSLQELPASMSHFRTGTDRVAVKCDKFSVSANPTHFTAIYNVVTDLLLYSDPVHKRHNSKLESLVFTHDFSNLSGVISLVSDLQKRIRNLTALLLQYRIHIDELTHEGRLDMYLILAEMIRHASELSLLIESISRAQALGGAVRSPTTGAGLLFEAKAPELTWHMHDKNDIPFAKFSVTGAEFSWTSKSDNSVSNRLIIKDLKALNSSPEHLFAEIIAKHHGDPENRLAKLDVFAAVLWNALPPVGGISIVEQFELHLHPIRLQLEHHVGRRILDYVFSQRRKSDDEGSQNDDDSDDDDSISTETKAKKSDRRVKPKGSSNSLRPPSIAFHSNKSAESVASSSRGNTGTSTPRTTNGKDHYLAPSGSTSQLASSSASIVSSSGPRQLRHASSMDVLGIAGEPVEQGLDAEEMRNRARLNRTFVFVEISPTTLCLTYRSEKSDHSRMFDLYNITYKTPSIQYRSKTWSFLDLLNELKKDTMKSIWSQRSALLGQYLSRAHHKLPLTEQRSAMKKSFTSTIKNRFLKSSSPSTSPSSTSSVAGFSPQRKPSSPLSRDRSDSPHPKIEQLDDDEIPIDQDIELAAQAQAEAKQVRGRRTATYDSLDSAEQAALLPFSNPKGDHFLEDQPIMSEPESMSPTSSSFDGESTNEGSRQASSEIPLTGSPQSMPELHSTLTPESDRSSTPEHARTLPAHLTTTPRMSFPIHRPLRASISDESDEHKAHMLLGSSFDS